MRPLSAIFPILGSLFLVLIVGVGIVALLQACAVRIPALMHLTACERQSELAAGTRLAALASERNSLEQRIFDLERELSAQQCVAIPYDPEAPLSDDFWADGDIGRLYGCWQLDTTYRTRDVDSGSIRTYREWQMCFDAEGNGTQVMRSGDGIVCEGTVKAGFLDGRLGFDEPGNMSCSDGGFIHERQIACVPAAGGRADCSTLQAETGGEGTAGFGRAAP